jgi:L-asparagine transporter-like permease
MCTFLFFLITFIYFQINTRIILEETLAFLIYIYIYIYIYREREREREREKCSFRWGKIRSTKKGQSNLIKKN